MRRVLRVIAWLLILCAGSGATGDLWLRHRAPLFVVTRSPRPATSADDDGFLSQVAIAAKASRDVLESRIAREQRSALSAILTFGVADIAADGSRLARQAIQRRHELVATDPVRGRAPPVSLLNS